MSKVVAIMSMSLDGYVADLNDGVAEVFDWYFTSGDVEIHTGGSDPMTFKVSGPSAFAVSRPDLVPCSPVGALSTSPEAGTEITLGDQHSYLPTTSPPDGRDPTRLSDS
jgi:hypothetical protein